MAKVIEDISALLTALGARWIIFGFLLVLFWTTIHQVLQQACSTLNNFCKPISAAGNQFVIISVAGAVLAFAVWLVSNEISKRETGRPIAPPGPPPISSPGFSTSGGFNVAGFHQEAGVSKASTAGSAEGAKYGEEPSVQRSRPAHLPRGRRGRRAGF